MGDCLEARHLHEQVGTLEVEPGMLQAWLSLTRHHAMNGGRHFAHPRRASGTGAKQGKHRPSQQLLSALSARALIAHLSILVRHPPEVLEKMKSRGPSWAYRGFTPVAADDPGLERLAAANIGLDEKRRRLAWNIMEGKSGRSVSDLLTWSCGFSEDARTLMSCRPHPS
ncbi:unnamed protein product [Symbiodinium natans]|uniref:Uncharacterized protein n=1 Tax=Symbiodinium natans TaxID=878477 RepID=A0A812PH42_9DINO|nr:unnamed protein product [Symbiodinium natans]